MTIHDCFKKYEDYTTCAKGTDKGTAHSYLQVYDECFRDMTPTKVLEIGIASGGSLAAWADYFGDQTTIIGMDITLKNVIHGKNKANVQMILGDATRFSDIHQHLGVEGSFDIIIDDGSHRFVDQVCSMVLLLDRVKDGGYYIIEDFVELTEENLNIIGKLATKHQMHAKIYDLRSVKGEWSDVMIVMQKRAS